MPFPICNLYSALDIGKLGEILLKLLVGGDVVVHLAVVELLVCHQIEVAGAGETEYDGLFLAGLLALESFIDSHLDGVAALGSGEDALYSCELLGCLEYVCLDSGNSLHITVVVELGQDGAHAVIAETACVVGSGDEVTAQSVHLSHGADLTGVGEVICELTSCEAWAGCRLDCDDLIISLASQLLAHEGGDQTAQIGAAACTADDDVGLYVVLVKSRLCLKTDDGLMEQHLIENAAQNVSVALGAHSDLNGLTDGAAEASGGAGMLSQDLLADVGGLGGGGGHACAVDSHDLTAEGLLLIGDLDHVDLAVQIEVGARHGQRGAPLTCAGLGGDALEALLLCVISLSDGGIQLVAAADVVALELVVDLRRGLELFLKAVSSHQRGGTVHAVELQDLVGDGNVSRVVVQFLLNKLCAENRLQIRGGDRLAGAGIDQGSGLVLHVGTDVVPCVGHLFLV